MSEFMELGPVPCNEECAQVGSDDFYERARKEYSAYKHQLERMFPNCNFRIKSFPHDFGTYYEVCVVYDENDEKATERALEVEGNLPENWDDEAKKELNFLLQEGGEQCKKD